MAPLLDCVTHASSPFDGASGGFDWEPGAPDFQSRLQ